MRHPSFFVFYCTGAPPPYPAALTAWHHIKFYFFQIILVLVHNAACLTQKPVLPTLQHSLHGMISNFISLRSFLCSFITRHASHKSPSSLPCSTHCMASYQVLLLSDHFCARSLRGMPHTGAPPPYLATVHHSRQGAHISRHSFGTV